MTKSQDAWAWVEVSFPEWRDAMNCRMLDVYAITIEESGTDDQILTSHWEMKQSPYEFVEWFGLKYDLTSRSDVG